MLLKVSRSFALVIQQLPTDLRNAVCCIFYLVLRALDTVEDDTSLATEVKVPILMVFHRHVYDKDWHFSCKFPRSPWVGWVKIKKGWNVLRWGGVLSG
ncbi:transferase [Lithospermum erythrorhizon]|uniref:Transferase n=1 Tax=Lithospermum erythrorhizon TaxID=34254 RepID=A0AAV3R406_LITER